MGGGGKTDVISSLLAGEVKTGSWVGGQSPLGQGSPRKRRDAASGNGRKGESVCM